MNITTTFTRLTSTFAAAVLIAGCASDSSKSTTTAQPQAATTQTSSAAPAQNPKKSSKYNPVANPPKVKFGQFKCVEIKPTTLVERHRNHEGNRNSAAKIDAMLHQQLRLMFAEVKVLAPDAPFSKPAERTLQMAPEIKDIRIITGGTRFWLGAMAGGSDLLLQVAYGDSQTGEMVANPEFAAGNNAWAGSWSMGATDNQIRDSVVAEVMGYMASHK